MPEKDSESNVKKGLDSASGRPSYLRGPLPQKRVDSDFREASDREAKSSTDRPEKSPAQSKGEVKEDVELYSWKIWLLPRRPLVSVLVVASVIGSVALAYWTFPQALFVAVITVILINRLAPYLFPVRYQMTEQKVGYRTFLARDVRNWDRFLTYREFHDGVLLTHDIRSVRGRMKESIFLYYHQDGSNRDEVLRVVSSKLKPPQEAFAEADMEKTKRGGLRAALERVRRLRPKD
ncbi:MAG TPA: hypothetical protein GX524_02255 [Firmicutes bacterium]|nr:hypothetical protein [Bacillota bacterium]